MERTPLFSIVLPTYNRPELVQRAVESVLAQSYTDWELLLIDDGSKVAIEPLLPLDAKGRIRYLYQDNQGKSAARNRGLSLAQGRYICFLDDDDLYLENHLSSLASVLTANQFPVAAIRSEAYRQRTNRRRPLPIMPRGSAGVRFVWRKGASPFFFALHRDIIAAFRFDARFPFAQDVHLLLRVLLHYPVLHTGQRTLVLVEHRNRSSHPAGLLALQENLRSRLAVIHDLQAQLGTDLDMYLQPKDIRYAQSKAYLLAAHQAFRLGAFREAWRYNAMAIRTHTTLSTGGQALRNMTAYFKGKPA